MAEFLNGSGLRHKNVATTMLYTHVLNRPGPHIRSPLDRTASSHNLNQNKC